MVRVADYNSRRKDVLRAVIDLFLETAHPISSEALIERFKFNFSSATIRNVLKDLEASGYLIHPHTSAGRVPTDLGYRFYINDLMHRVDLSSDEKDTIERFLDFNQSRGCDVFESASRILSKFTHYAGVVTRRDRNTVYYCGLSYLLEQPEFKDTERFRLIFRALEEDRLLEVMRHRMNNSIEVLIGAESNCIEMDSCSLIVCECEDSQGDSVKLALLGPRRMAYSRVIPMIDYVSELISRSIE